MFCPECGNKLPDDAQFCAECGYAVKSAPVQSAVTVNDASADNAAVVYQAPPRQPMSEESKLKLKFSFVLLLLYVAISLIFILTLGAKNGVVIKAEYVAADGVSVTEYDSGVTLNELASTMVKGNSMYNPTMLTSAIGVGMYIFIFAVPVLALVAFVTTCIGKRFYSLHILSSVVSFASAAFMGAVVPVSMMLVADFKEMLYAEAGVFAQSVQSVGYIKLIIFASLAAVCVVASMVVTAMYNKRRAQYEQ